MAAEPKKKIYLYTLKTSRLTTLTDGIFAIAMTILVFGIHVPNIDLTHLRDALKNIVATQLSIYAGSFIILGTQWIGINFEQSIIERVTRIYFWITILFLMLICIIPFSASLIAKDVSNPVSIYFFATNLLCIVVIQIIMLIVAHVQKLTDARYSQYAMRLFLRRILISPICYFAAIITAHWNTSIAFILLIAPPLFYLFPGKIDTYTVDL